MTVATITTAAPARTVAPAGPGGALSLGHMTPHEAWLFCESLAQTPLLPDAYRKQPASVLWAMEYGRALGLDVVTTITTIHVIKGKPCQSADLMLGRARAAGHRVRIKSERTQCVVSVQRVDDPDDETSVEWTLDDAVTARLCEIRNGRPYARDQKNQPTSWEKYPRAMLRARAIAEAVRIACPEVLHGAIYTPEEMGAVVDQDGNAVYVERTDAPVMQQATVVQHPTAVQEATAEQEATARRDYLAEARAAVDAAAVRQVWEEAKAAGAPPAYLDQVAAIGRDKPGAKPVPTAPTAPETGDEDQDDEHAVAHGEMLDAAAAAGLNAAEAAETLRARFGVGIEEATVEQVRAHRDDLLDAAKGAAR